MSKLCSRLCFIVLLMCLLFSGGIYTSPVFQRSRQAHNPVLTLGLFGNRNILAGPPPQNSVSDVELSKPDHYGEYSSSNHNHSAKVALTGLEGIFQKHKVSPGINLKTSMNTKNRWNRVRQNILRPINVNQLNLNAYGLSKETISDKRSQSVTENADQTTETQIINQPNLLGTNGKENGVVCVPLSPPKTDIPENIEHASDDAVFMSKETTTTIAPSYNLPRTDFLDSFDEEDDKIQPTTTSKLEIERGVESTSYKVYTKEEFTTKTILDQVDDSIGHVDSEDIVITRAIPPLDRGVNNFDISLENEDVTVYDGKLVTIDQITSKLQDEDLFEPTPTSEVFHDHVNAADSNQPLTTQKFENFEEKEDVLTDQVSLSLQPSYSEDYEPKISNDTLVKDESTDEEVSSEIVSNKGTDKSRLSYSSENEGLNNSGTDLIPSTVSIPPIDTFNNASEDLSEMEITSISSINPTPDIPRNVHEEVNQISATVDSNEAKDTDQPTEEPKVSDTEKTPKENSTKTAVPVPVDGGRVIIDVPQADCAAGQMRDRRGKCRKVVRK